jgi:hypothetical protein
MLFPKRKPAKASDVQMIDLDELLLPVSFGYHIAAPWGGTRQMISRRRS